MNPHTTEHRTPSITPRGRYRLRNLIGGRWVAAGGPETLEIVDPATGTCIGVLPSSSRRDVHAAVEAAGGAATTWSSLAVEDRVGVLVRFADVLERYVGDIAAAEQRDMGRPAAVGRTWVGAAVAAFRRNVELALEYPFDRAGDDGSTTVVRRPLGVAAVIVPWNFPANIVLGALGPLLAAGNTVVVKPSEKASLSTVRMAELSELAGLPAGVLNVVLGPGATGVALSDHPAIGLTHFTGSVQSGVAVATAAARRMGRVVLELGGKDPAIVDDGVDVAAVARDVARGAFTNTGQICTSIERIYVHRNVAELFVAELTDAADELTHGSRGTPLGPMVDRAQRDVVRHHVRDALDRGAVLRTGGRTPDRTGFWYPATVLTGVTDDMLVMSEETFGPVAPVQVVDTFEQAVEQATLTPYGLAATVYTTDGERADLAARRIPSAITWINRWRAAGSQSVHEPAGLSGITATGHFATYDAATRASSVITADARRTSVSRPQKENTQ